MIKKSSYYLILAFLAWGAMVLFTSSNMVMYYVLFLIGVVFFVLWLVGLITDKIFSLINFFKGPRG